MIAGAGTVSLPTQIGEDFRDSSLQVASLAALLQDGDSFGWQSGGDGSKLVPSNIGKPARVGHVSVLQQRAVDLHCPFPCTLVSEDQCRCAQRP